MNTSRPDLPRPDQAAWYLLVVRTRQDVPFRSYSNEQIEAFLEADRLDEQTLNMIETLEARDPAASSDE